RLPRGRRKSGRPYVDRPPRLARATAPAPTHTSAAQSSVTPQMMVGITELLADQGQTAEGVGYLQLFGHPHAAMQLHGFLRNLAARVRRFDLRGAGDAAALGRVL